MKHSLQIETREKKSTQWRLVILCLIAFLPVLKADFVYYDDPEYILNNRFIQQFSWQNLRSVFLGAPTILYVPLTHLSFTIEYVLFGEKPFVFHLVNLVLHTLNALLLYKLLLKLNVKSKLVMNGVLLFFSVHPLVSESVCWITERKDVLYVFFYFLSASAFLDFVNDPNRRRYLLALLYFILACLSKPMALTLPFLLVLYLLYLKRDGRKVQLLSVLPFLALSVFFAWLTFYTVNVAKPHQTLELSYSWSESLLLAFSAAGFYLVKPFFPWNQQVIYPFPEAETLFSHWDILLYAIVFSGALLVFVIRGLKKEHRISGMLFLCWLVCILPLLQLDSNNHSYQNERYFYLSIVFPAALFFLFLQKLKIKESDVRNLTILLAVVFVLLTFKRSMVWKNTLSLFTAELKAEPDDAYALNNLGYFYNASGNYQQGMEVLQRAVRLKPSDPVYLNNLGWALSELNAPDSAVSCFRRALYFDSNSIPALNNLGVMFAKSRMKDSAGIVFKKAYDLNPEDGESNYYMGVYYNFIGETERATPYFEKAKALGNRKARSR